MEWFRKRKEERHVHVENELALHEAQEELRKAERQLAETVERSGEVARVAEVIENIGRRNHIGPSFFDALGIQRQQRRKA